MRALSTFRTPQLNHLHSGKVRESFRVDDRRRLIVVTDRISCFDRILDTPIPGKGAVLNSIARHWFERTRALCPNHLEACVDPQASLVSEAVPIRVEVVVRGHLTGSAWKAYEQGKRTFSGVTLPDGLAKNRRFASRILTPTTKEKSDREISPEEIVSSGLATAGQWEEMASRAMAVFEIGSTELASLGVILVDTKYEFGLVGGRLTLIDEVHTPDSSRFWIAADWERDPESVRSLDKEFVREWLLDQERRTGTRPTALPDEVVTEAAARYREIHRLITGEEAPALAQGEDAATRLLANLCRAGLTKEGWVAICMGSKADVAHAKKIADVIREYGVFVELRVVSAHKNGERIADFAREYGTSDDPGAVIAVAGRSNGLGGALAANLPVPVISCPPFDGASDVMLNAASSLMMPSRAPAATVVDPVNAALLAVRCLNRPALRSRLAAEIDSMKRSLLDDDRTVRGRD